LRQARLHALLNFLHGFLCRFHAPFRCVCTFLAWLRTFFAVLVAWRVALLTLRRADFAAFFARLTAFLATFFAARLAGALFLPAPPSNFAMREEPSDDSVLLARESRLPSEFCASLRCFSALLAAALRSLRSFFDLFPDLTG